MSNRNRDTMYNAATSRTPADPNSTGIGRCFYFTLDPRGAGGSTVQIMRESAVERHLITEVKRLGGQCIKLMPIVAGVPDRLVLLPGGRSYLIELKATTGRLRPIQRVWHQRSEAIGHPVVTLLGRDGVDDWLLSLKAVVD